MIHANGDVSMDEKQGLLSVGYVIYRSKKGDEELLDTGTRIINTEADGRDIDWCSNRGEYFSAIVATRAALDYSNEPIILRLDNEPVVQAIKRGDDTFEDYFAHAVKSFLHRFDDWYVQNISRDNNEVADKQASVGLQMAREIKSGTL
jgi:ribonuclease HI